MTETASGAHAPGQVAQAASVAKESAAGVGTTAKDAGGQVASTAKDAGGQVATTAVEQGKQVAAEAKAQARDLLGEARGQASAQTVAQKDKAVTGIRSLADELGSMVDAGGQNGTASELARQASTKAHEIA